MKELAFDMTGRNPQSIYLNAGLLAGSPQALVGLIDRMNIEGYEDDPEIVDLPEPMQIIPKGYSATRRISVPYGFSYNPTSMGIDADSVEIEFTLKDEDGTIMDSMKKTVNLT